jgi:trimethylamine:corrinoid methyltransferase-like protein
MTALATGHGAIEAGLLGIDEVCSPIQMILDHDLAGGLQTLLDEADLEDIEAACEEIRSVGIGGSHFGTEFTARRFRHDLYLPSTWSYQILAGWESAGSKLDIDHARDRVNALENASGPTAHISEDEEAALLRILQDAIRLGLARR